MPKEKMWVHWDEGARPLDSIKTPGHKSALARDGANKLSQTTSSPLRFRDVAARDVVMVGVGLALGMAALGVAHVIRKRKVAKVDGSTETETEVEGAESAETEATESAATRAEVDDLDALIEDTYSVIEDSKATRVNTTPVVDQPEEDPELGIELRHERRRQVRGR